MLKVFRFKNHDWFLTIAIFLLVIIGLVVIYSATFNAQTQIEGAGTVNRQLIFVILGFVLYFLFSNIDPQLYRLAPFQVVIFVIITGLLLYVWLFGDPIRNTNRWIEWGFIRIQPSEYSKIALIILNAGILSSLLSNNTEPDENLSENKKSTKLRRNVFLRLKDTFVGSPVLFHYFLAVLCSFVSIILILVEPALGNASIVALISLSIFLAAFPNQKILWCFLCIFLLGVNLSGRFINLNGVYQQIGISFFYKNLDILMSAISIFLIIIFIVKLRLKLISVFLTFFIGITCVLGISSGISILKEKGIIKAHQLQRIEVFFHPEDDPQGAGWQLRQSRIAIGSGRLFGKGFLQGSQSKLRYLPEAYNDFIFAAFCEEFGLIGALFIIGLYAFIVFRIIHAGRNGSGPYESLLCFGVATMVLLHVFINMGMNMGILPVTGIPLPLMSYGGSSVIITMIALGIVQSVNVHKDVVDMQESLVIRSKSLWMGETS